MEWRSQRPSVNVEIEDPNVSIRYPSSDGGAGQVRSYLGGVIQSLMRDPFTSAQMWEGSPHTLSGHILDTMSDPYPMSGESGGMFDSKDQSRLPSDYEDRSRTGEGEGAYLTAPESTRTSYGGPERNPIFNYARGGSPQSGGQSSGTPARGLLRGSPGRTDRLPVLVEEDSYVIPADVVSGFYGQGDSESGGRLLDAIFGGHYRRGMAEGGPVGRPRLRPIVAAGGEYIVGPQAVISVGGGSAEQGHKTLDGRVLDWREKTAKRLRQLPGPRRD